MSLAQLDCSIVVGPGERIRVTLARSQSRISKVQDAVRGHKTADESTMMLLGGGTLPVLVLYAYELNHFGASGNDWQYFVVGVIRKALTGGRRWTE